MDERLKSIVEESSRIVFFGGAGVSTESNIPDFRSESGLYNAVQKYGYPPETMLSRSFYDKNTEVFFKYYKENLIYREAKPNKAHIALALLEKQGKLLSVVTQNIDGLHQMAGSRRVHELHGSILRNYCSGCHTFYDLDYMMEQENCKDENSTVPVCRVCGRTVKPDVVLYEEPLNDKVIEEAVSDISKADCLIIGGTSLTVYPAAGFINYFRGRNLVLINKTKTPYDGKANLVIYDSLGKVLGD